MFVTYPSHSEGSLHTTRLRIISNKTLFQNASRVGLPSYIQAKPFAPRQWHPPNFEFNRPSRTPDNNTHGPIARVNVKDMDVSRQAVMDPAPESSLSRTESPAGPMPSQKPKKKNNTRQTEDTQWLGDKVTYSGSIWNFPVLSIALYIGYCRCCRSHHRSCICNRRTRNCTQGHEGPWNPDSQR